MKRPALSSPANPPQCTTLIFPPPPLPSAVPLPSCPSPFFLPFPSLLNLLLPLPSFLILPSLFIPSHFYLPPVLFHSSLPLSSLSFSILPHLPSHPSHYSLPSSSPHCYPVWYYILPETHYHWPSSHVWNMNFKPWSVWNIYIQIWSVYMYPRNYYFKN